MTAMPPLRDILNNTPVNAIDVDFNFNTIEAHIGAEVINRDGSVAMTGALSLSGPPTAPQQAATKAYVDSAVIPVGTIWEFAGNIAPSGWAFCDGSSKSTTDPAYAALFAVIGYRHGGAGGNFNLPDRRARVAIGYSAGDAVAGTLGARGGNRDLVVPQHSHGQDQHQHGGSTNDVDTNHWHALNHTHGMQHSHDSNVRQGYDVVVVGNYIGQNWSNAVFTPSPGGALSGTYVGWVNRPTAITQNQVPGEGRQYTGGSRDNTDGASPNTSAWQSEHHSNYHHAHSITSDFRTPAIHNAGVAPTNANYPLYEVVNFIIRIG